MKTFSTRAKSHLSPRNSTLNNKRNSVGRNWSGNTSFGRQKRVRLFKMKTFKTHASSNLHDRQLTRQSRRRLWTATLTSLAWPTSQVAAKRDRGERAAAIYATRRKFRPSQSCSSSRIWFRRSKSCKLPIHNWLNVKWSHKASNGLSIKATKDQQLKSSR